MFINIYISNLKSILDNRELLSYFLKCYRNVFGILNITIDFYNRVEYFYYTVH